MFAPLYHWPQWSGSIKQNVMETVINKTATNYIHAEQYLKEYKEHLQAKYGKGFKGSQLTEIEIDTLCFYKEQLRSHSITIDQYVTRVR